MGAEHRSLPGWNTEVTIGTTAPRYIQDDWKVNSRLTVNLGVRYDFIQPESSKAGELANFIISSQTQPPRVPVQVGSPQLASGTYILPAKVANSAPLSPGFMRC